MKQKCILDHLRKGLAILGLHFVHSHDAVSAAYVKALLKPSTSHDPNVRNVVRMLYAFLQNSSKDDLLDFLCFATACV